MAKQFVLRWEEPANKDGPCKEIWSQLPQSCRDAAVVRWARLVVRAAQETARGDQAREKPPE